MNKKVKQYSEFLESIGVTELPTLISILNERTEVLTEKLKDLEEVNNNLTKLLNNEQKKLTKKEQIIKDLKAKVSELEEANIQANQKIMSIQKDYIELANQKINGDKENA